MLDIGLDDLPFIERWLHADHVRRHWGDPEENSRLLRAPPVSGHWRAIIEANGRKVGLVLWQHPSRHELDQAGLHDIPGSVIDIDIMIGDATRVGQGVGTEAIRLVVEQALANPAVPFVIAGTSITNHASRRAFTKAGFSVDRDFDDPPGGRFVLMVRRRHAFG